VIGAETINGVAVWHIRADLPITAATPTSRTATPTPTAPSTTDIYIRQDNDYLVKTIVHTTGTTPSDVTLTVTKYDSGVTITLPRV
jgi:hypothetical protein